MRNFDSAPLAFGGLKALRLQAEQHALRRRVAELRTLLRAREAELIDLRSAGVVGVDGWSLEEWTCGPPLERDDDWMQGAAPLARQQRSDAQPEKPSSAAADAERMSDLRRMLDLVADSDVEKEARGDALFDGEIPGQDALALSDAEASARSDPASTACYTSFITALRSDESAALVRAIKRFVIHCRTVGGETGRPPTPPCAPSDAPARRRGAARQERQERQTQGERGGASAAAAEPALIAPLCDQTRGFLQMMETAIMSAPEWAAWRVSAPADARLVVRESLERLLMTKLGFALMDQIDVTCAERNAALLEKMQRLAHLTPDELGVPREMRNEMVFAIAQSELRRLEREAPLPHAKLVCIEKVRVCSRYEKRRVGAARMLPSPHLSSPHGGSPPLLSLSFFRLPLLQRSQILSSARSTCSCPQEAAERTSSYPCSSTLCSKQNSRTSARTWRTSRRFVTPARSLGGRDTSSSR
jgi:hypothetical protein